MAVPNVTITATADGSDTTLAPDDLSIVVSATDTTTYSPAVTARQWRVNGVALDQGSLTPAQLATVDIVIDAPGTYQISLTGTNADGSDDSSNVEIVVTDSLTAGLTVVPGTARVLPSQLPAEYRDAQKCTPGMPNSAAVVRARTTGTVGGGGPTLIDQV